MSMKKLTGSLIGELRKSIPLQGLDGRKDISALSLSTESMDETARTSAIAARDTLSEVVANAVAMIVSTESAGVTLTHAQRSAAKLIAGLAVDPGMGMRSIGAGTLPNAMQGAVTVSAEDMGIMDAQEANVLSTEAFDGQSNNNALYFSIAYNLFAAKQDSFGETFFPTITIDPSMSGITIGTEVTSLYKDFARNIDGSSSRNRFTKVTLAKAIYDNNLLGGDRNKVVPVSRPENAASLLTALERVDTTTGESITTAPLLIGSTVDLLGISQTDAQLAKGSMDAYDSLDRAVNLQTIIVSISAVVATVATTELFRIPVGMLPASNFTYTTQGQEKDLGLDFESADIAFLTSSTTTYNGSASTILGSLAPGHTVKLRIKLTGDGNTQHGDISVYSNVVATASVIDAAGNVLPTTSATQQAIATIFDAALIVGYELEAYTTNSNLRKEGQLVTIDSHEQVYNVPVRSGVSVVMPVNSGANDDSRLVGQIQTTGYCMSLEAVNTLVSFTDNLNIMTANGANTDLALMGVGRHHVDAYYREDILDLAVIVDSESSSERGEDIRSALISRIRDGVYTAFTASKYDVAHSLINGTDEAKVGVIIGTSSRIKNYLCEAGQDTIDLGAGFLAKVVSTPNKLIGDVMYVTFSNHMEAGTTDKVDPLSFGQNVWAPTITTDVSTTIRGANTRRFQTHPRYAHIINLPIMLRFPVTNLTAVLGKVARYTTAV